MHVVMVKLVPAKVRRYWYSSTENVGMAPSFAHQTAAREPQRITNRRIVSNSVVRRPCTRLTLVRGDG